MNLYRIIYHYLTTYTDGFGNQQNAEAAGPFEGWSLASSSANAVTALQGTLTIPSGQTFQAIETIPAEITGVVVGS